jgi:hypothetical protein
MCSPRALRYAIAAILLGIPRLALAQPAYQVQPEALRELRANMPTGRVLTVSSRGGGIDTVSARAPLRLRVGQLLVAKQGDTAAVPAQRLAQRPPPITVDPTEGDSTGAVVQDPGATITPDPTVSGAAVVELPYSIATPDPAAPSELRFLQARVEIRGGGFHYEPSSRTYVGRVLIGIVDRDNPGRKLSLADVDIQIGGDIDQADPGTISLLHTSVPFTDVVLRANHPRADQIPVRVISSFDPAGITIAVPVFAPYVLVTASPVHIAGLGLEKTDVLIEPPFDGSMRMMVTARRAHPEPDHLSVGPSDPGVVHVRSQGLGTDTILVRGGVYSAQVLVVYDTPWLFLGAVLVGGILGGMLNALSRARRQKSAPLWRLPVQGALTGMVVAVLYAVGIHVFRWAPDAQYGEGLMFAVAFIGGLAGPRIFDPLLPSRGGNSGTPGAPKRAPAPAPSV